MDGEVLKMSVLEEGVNSPSLHPNCRSTTVPYFEDMAGVEERGAARDEGGKTYYVPSDMSYRDWEEKFADVTPNHDIINNNWSDRIDPKKYTKTEAIERLNNHHGIEFEDSRKYPIDEKIMSKVVSFTDAFSDIYTDFIKQNPCKIPVIKNLAPSRMKGAVGYYSYYRNRLSVAELALNARYYSDTSFFQQQLGRAMGSKHWISNASNISTYIHEFGHHVANSMRWISEDINWEQHFIKDCIAQYNDLTNSDIKGYWDSADIVSRYEATSPSELFDEEFSEYFGDDNLRQFATIFGEKLDSILKGVK